MTRKELLAVPKRKHGETLTGVSGVWVIPSRRKHESGWAIMDFVAETKEGLVGFGECCDVIAFEGKHFRMDCDHKTKLLHVWNHYKFSIYCGLSSISFVEGKDNA